MASDARSGATLHQQQRLDELEEHLAELRMLVQRVALAEAQLEAAVDDTHGGRGAEEKRDALECELRIMATRGEQLQSQLDALEAEQQRLSGAIEAQQASV